MNFITNKEYDRQELLDFVGSKQVQSGIIWGPKEFKYVIITSGGRNGKRARYGDKKNDDGTWSYFGQGEKGDQNPDSFANSLLTKRERVILFFTTREPNAEEVRIRGNYRKLYKFEGEFKVGYWDYFVPQVEKRAFDKLIQFLLIPVNKNYLIEQMVNSEMIPLDTLKMHKLKKKVKKNSLNPNRTTVVTTKEFYQRSLNVKNYALLRANGICELCLNPAPFINIHNFAFLEVHHILSLLDEGPDLPENVAAICPNCHRECHFCLSPR